MREPLDSHPDINWPAGFSPDDAHVFFGREATVPIPPDRAFALLTDVSSWPEWSPGVTGVGIDALAQVFTVQWYGHRFEVFVGENSPPHRVGWLGIGAGVQLYQAWLITPAEGGTHILTENVVRSGAPKALDTLSALWKERLDTLWQAQYDRMSDALTP
ncbi:SRPBCC family protein [Streptomyces sp. NPDC059639]|uniref:SRPBCC family protein n=1 Tax=Streptomyces sp. NPDC059639 TaxID=3346891 RepID=UPI0036BDFEBA